MGFFCFGFVVVVCLFFGFGVLFFFFLNYCVSFTFL